MSNTEVEHQETTHVFQDYQGGTIDSLEMFTLLQKSDHSFLFSFVDAYCNILVPSVHTSTVFSRLVSSHLGVVPEAVTCIVRQWTEGVRTWMWFHGKTCYHPVRSYLYIKQNYMFLVGVRRSASNNLLGNGWWFCVGDTSRERVHKAVHNLLPPDASCE